MPPPVQNPFVGPRPYAAAERDRFFGRAGERRDLAGLVVANRLTVLYGPTGAGKTSLLQAGLVPELERAGFQVMPVARPGGLLPPGTDPARLRNIYTANVLMHWHHGELEGIAQHTLATYLRGMPQADEHKDRPLAILLDQLEDLFTTHDAQWEQRQAFLEELAECAAEARPGERPLRLVLSIRDEQLAALERHAGALPDLLRVRLRLDPLRLPAAIEVITSVARGNFSRQDAEQLAHQLAQRRVRVRGKLTTVPDEFIEPMQLQLACEEKWRRGRGGAYARPGDPDEAIARFYDAAVARARLGWGGERKIRRFVEDKLFTPEGARAAVVRGKRTTGGLANKLVDRLEAERLLASEERLGARWYELAHDRLAAPVRLSDRTWFESQRRKGKALRVSLVVLLVLGALVGGFFLVRWALAKYRDLDEAKRDVETQLADARKEVKKLDARLGRKDDRIAAEGLRARQLRADTDLVAFDADVQAVADVGAEMSRYSPSLRDIDTQAETLTAFVAAGDELPGLRARFDALAAGLTALADEHAAALVDSPKSTALAEIGAAITAQRAELTRLAAALGVAEQAHANHATRLAAELEAFEAPAPRPGSGTAGRVREQSRQDWREGLRALLLGQNDQARARFERAQGRDPTNPAAHDMLGRLALEAGDPKAAEQSFRRALAQAPTYAPSLGGMAAVYLTKEWFLDAELCARTALAAQPFYSPPRTLLRELNQRRAAQAEPEEEELSRKNPCQPPPPAPPPSPTDAPPAPGSP